MTQSDQADVQTKEMQEGNSQILVHNRDITVGNHLSVC